MPTADVCGNCHLQEFAERESERDTITWPKDQWPKGRPSHALDYRANVEVEVYAGMSQREIADGCTSATSIRTSATPAIPGMNSRWPTRASLRPAAPATAAPTTINWEAYTMSKHGMQYQARKGKLELERGAQGCHYQGRAELHRPAQSCHMEYQGKFTSQRGA